MVMRNGYPAPWTLGEQLESGWFGRAGDPHFEKWRRICAIQVDGQPLYDVHPLRRTPSPHEIRYSQKFSEVMLAAHALAQIDACVAIDTGGAKPLERPDLHATVDGYAVGIEVGEVQPYAAATNAALEVHIALNELADSDQALRPVHTYLHICRSPGRGNASAMLPATRKCLLRIVAAILRSGRYREWAGDRARRVDSWPGAALGYTLYAAKALSPYGYIKFDDSACSYDPQGLIAPALRMLERKRRMAASYDGSRPLWLILGLTEQVGLYTESIRWLGQRASQIAPFERVIAHDGMTFATYRAA